VKIKGTCKACGREFLAEQVIEAGGACPWCGVPFSPDYALTVVESLRDAAQAGNRLERALEEIADIEPAFTLDPETVLGAIKRHLAKIERTMIAQP
jgi:hypothetical protein